MANEKTVNTGETTMTRNDLTLNDVDHDHKYDAIDTYASRCYGPTGDDLGDVPVGICPVTIRGTQTEAWGVFEIPDECTNLIAVCDTREEAVAAAEQYIAENDEG